VHRNQGSRKGSTVLRGRRGGGFQLVVERRDGGTQEVGCASVGHDRKIYVEVIHCKGDGGSAAGNIPTAPRRFDTCWLYLRRQRPKFIAPTSPNDVLEPSSPIGMLTLGLMLNRELNTNPVPSVSSP